MRPDLTLLDLNLPRKDGREVLRDTKGDEALKDIPVAVLTTSDDGEDIPASYALGAKCYVIKPLRLDDFDRIVQPIEDIWPETVKLAEGDRNEKGKHSHPVDRG